MNKKIIDLESTFTPYTLDTYQTFDIGSDDDMLLEDINNEQKVDLTYDNIDWTYDTKGFLEALTDNRHTLLKDNIIDGVILDIIQDGDTTSPREYNHDTDKQHNKWVVDYDKLQQYIKDNQADFYKNKIHSYDGFMWFGDIENTMLHYYLYNESIKKLSSCDYQMAQYDTVSPYQYVEYKIIK